MSIEQTPNIIPLTREEFELISSASFDSTSEDTEKVNAIMAEKGISFDTGVIDVEIDGVPRKMVTNKDDFGTLVTQVEEEEENSDMLS